MSTESRSTRTIKACQSCKETKKKCNGQSPCSRCERLQKTCVYSAPKPPTQVGNGVISSFALSTLPTEPTFENISADSSTLIFDSLSATSPGTTPFPTSLELQLINVFFVHCYRMLSLLHYEKFMTRLLYLRDLPLCLIHSMCAYAAGHCEEIEDGDNPIDIGKRFAASVKELLEAEKDNVEKAQAMIIISAYHQHNLNVGDIQTVRSYMDTVTNILAREYQHLNDPSTPSQPVYMEELNRLNWACTLTKYMLTLDMSRTNLTITQTFVLSPPISDESFQSHPYNSTTSIPSRTEEDIIIGYPFYAAFGLLLGNILQWSRKVHHLLPTTTIDHRQLASLRLQYLALIASLEGCVPYLPASYLPPPPTTIASSSMVWRNAELHQKNDTFLLFHLATLMLQQTYTELLLRQLHIRRNRTAVLLFHAHILSTLATASEVSAIVRANNNHSQIKPMIVDTITLASKAYVSIVKFAARGGILILDHEIIRKASMNLDRDFKFVKELGKFWGRAKAGQSIIEKNWKLVEAEMKPRIGKAIHSDDSFIGSNTRLGKRKFIEDGREEELAPVNEKMTGLETLNLSSNLLAAANANGPSSNLNNELKDLDDFFDQFLTNIEINSSIQAMDENTFDRISLIEEIPTNLL